VVPELVEGRISVHDQIGKRYNITQDPEINFPQLQMHFFLEGASPSEMQKNVVFPIEAEIRAISDMLSELEAALRPLKVYGDINLSLFQYRDFEYPSPFALVLSGNNVDILKTFAKDIDDSLRGIEGVETMQNPMKSNQLNMRLVYLEEPAKVLGIAKNQIDPFVSMLTYGYEIDRFRDSRGQEFPLLLKITPDENYPIDILREIMVPSVKGGKIPLSEVVSPSFEESESVMTHIQFQPTVEIDFWIKEGFTAEEVAANVKSAVLQLDVPSSILVEIGGALQKKTQDFQSIGKNLLLIAALIFTIFVLQFKSFSPGQHNLKDGSLIQVIQE
jgi:multidrug efflux pump subunit AcrB